MHAECINQRIEHDLRLRGVLAEKRCDLLDGLQRLLDDILSLLDDSLAPDRRRGYILEESTEKALGLNEEEGNAEILVLEMDPVLPRMREIELIAELISERHEALARLSLDHLQYALVDKTIFHIPEEPEEELIAVRYLEIGIDDDDAGRESAESLHLLVLLS